MHEEHEERNRFSMNLCDLIHAGRERVFAAMVKSAAKKYKTCMLRSMRLLY